MTNHRIATNLWHHVEHADDGSDYWQTADLIAWNDGRIELRTNTRGSVVPMEMTLTPSDVDRLRQALRKLP